MMTLFKLALRDLRGGWRGFRLFVACLALGVAAITAVGTVSASLINGLAAQGQAILGGDIEVRISHREMTEKEARWFNEQAVRHSSVATMRAMARAPSTDRRSLIDLKAVDAAYPLVGALQYANADNRDLAMRDGRYGVAVEETLLLRLGVKVGDEIVLNQTPVEIRQMIVSEPDRIAGGMAAGPRVMLSHAALAATGLVTPGTLISYAYRYILADGATAASMPRAAAKAFPQSGFRVNTSLNGADSVKRFVERTATFLTLVGLTALLIGGVGVGNAVTSYLNGKTDMIGTLKATGADTRQVFVLFGFEVLIMAIVGIIFGLALGTILPLLALDQLVAQMPVPIPVNAAPAFGALAIAGCYGLLAAILFALMPLIKARDLSPAHLFRALVGASGVRPKPLDWLILGGLVAAMLALAILPASDPFFAMLFCVGAVGVFAVLRAIGFLVEWAAARAPKPRNAIVRLGVGNLHRPGAPTASTVLSLGLGLTLISAVAVIEGNIAAQIDDEIPDRAPAFFLIDVQGYQVEALKSLVAEAPGAGALEIVPSMRGRLEEINGVPVEDVTVHPDAAWALRGDRGLTWARTPPENAEIVAGDWWPHDYDGAPLISFDVELAEGFGISVGDTLTYNLLGRNVTGTIVNLRQINWQAMGINYSTVFSPGLLSNAPHTWMATLHVNGAEAEADMYRAITDEFPNITTIRVKEALTEVAKMVTAMGTAVRVTGAVTLLAAVLVLAGAVAAGHRARVYDAVVLKVLGATSGQVMRAYLLEYGLLGLLTAVMAAGLGSLVAFLVITQMMEAPYRLLPETLVAVLLGGVAFTLTVGMAGTWRALRARPAQVLRSL
ncbi:MAG: ABC transporter permease [Alphaproteobacteria bacterium]